jgi:hypothetical protein
VSAAEFDWDALWQAVGQRLMGPPPVRGVMERRVRRGRGRGRRCAAGCACGRHDNAGGAREPRPTPEPVEVSVHEVAAALAEARAERAAWGLRGWQRDPLSPLRLRRERVPSRFGARGGPWDR